MVVVKECSLLGFLRKQLPDFCVVRAITMIFTKKPCKQDLINSLDFNDDSQQFEKTSAINENIFENLLI